MGIQSRREYLEAVRKRYHLANKREKGIILNEFCKVCEYNRKYAIRLLSHIDSIMLHRGKRRAGCPKKYSSPVILEVLKRIWTMLNLPCSRRLRAALPLWLPHYEAHYRTTLTAETRSLIESISSSTIDRFERLWRHAAYSYR